jgi:TPR repeat protein
VIGLSDAVGPDQDSDDYDPDSLEDAAHEALESGDPVRYCELMKQANRWPPPMGASAEEIIATANQDHAALHAMLERNAALGSLDALRTLIGEAYEADQVDVARGWMSRTAQFLDPEIMKAIGSQAEHQGDLNGARMCFQLAGDAGDVDALFLAGRSALSADDPVAAKTLLEKAAEAGQPDAAIVLAGLIGEDGDDEQARAWLERAADLGSGDAMCGLALLYLVQGDEETSLTWLDRGADVGHAGAILLRFVRHPDRQVEYALQLRDRVAASLDLDDFGGVLVEGDVADATAYPEDALWKTSPALIECGETEAAARHRAVARARYEARVVGGDTEAMLNLGQLLIEDGDEAAGRELIKKAAGLGDADAKAALAELGGGGRSWWRRKG